ncbi:Phospholipid phosphatase 1 [Saguinus oedipus]|uniref:Phospholipid phosphatase 1 n=1 Tax=Saguinus oedipus TaxID=9490 RepID=A0ABQ9W9Y4_SAGOE|nr:Phospholipid phosphatase 1 [Saguinus oedipus]
MRSVLVVFAGLPFAILTSRHTPFQRGVFCNDESIKYPYKEDTIPYALLGGIIIPFSIIVMILGETLSVYCNLLHSNSFIRNNYIATIYKAIGTFLFGAAASQSLTDIAKYSIGRLRPHFLDVCDPDWSKINCSDGYIENYICRGNAEKVKEGRLSFYSGHSSFSMYCMLFVAATRTQADLEGWAIARAFTVLRALPKAWACDYTEGQWKYLLDVDVGPSFDFSPEYTDVSLLFTLMYNS